MMKGQTAQPLFRQIADRISSDLVSHGTEHSAIPTERELTQRYGVSRDTIRRALTFLNERGLIYTRPGAGSFIATRRSVHKKPQITSFTQDMAERGYRATSEVIELRRVPASPQIAAHLGVQPGEPVFEIVRLRRADSSPMAFERAFVITAPFNGEPDPTGSLDEQLTAAGYRITTATEKISAVALNEQVAMALRQPLSAPGLRVFRVGYTAAGRAVEATETIYRADRYDFELEIRREERDGN